MFKNVIFDFDGVIIDSHKVQKKALYESYKQVVGKGEPPYNDFFYYSGDSLTNIFNHLELPLDMIPIYNRISLENVSSIKLHLGIYELLNELVDNKISCSLCTGKDRFRTIKILENLGIKKYFNMVVCSDDVKIPKPNPESLIKIKKTLNCNKYDMVMVGDGINDILIAKYFGINSIAVTWGDLNVDVLKKFNPNYIVNTIKELKKTIMLS